MTMQRIECSTHLLMPDLTGARRMRRAPPPSRCASSPGGSCAPLAVTRCLAGAAFRAAILAGKPSGRPLNEREVLEAIGAALQTDSGVSVRALAQTLCPNEPRGRLLVLVALKSLQRKRLVTWHVDVDCRVLNIRILNAPAARV